MERFTFGDVGVKTPQRFATSPSREFVALIRMLEFCTMSCLPDQVGYGQCGVEITVAVQQHYVARRTFPMPAFRVRGKHQDVVGKKHRLGGNPDARQFL